MAKDLSFGDIFPNLVRGEAVFRSSWDSSGAIYVQLVLAPTPFFQKRTGYPYRTELTPGVKEGVVFVHWNPSAEDIVANDWCLL
jgi:hypothetical protein